MFGLMSRRERSLLIPIVEEKKQEIVSLRNELSILKTEMAKAIEWERLRAEGAINLLLLKTQKAVLTPAPGPGLNQEEMLEKAFDLFGDEGSSPLTADQEKTLLEIQR